MGGLVMDMAAETRTIVLVHGAWADATGFDAEIRALRGRGHTAIGFGNPLRDLDGDAAYLAEFLRTLSGPIVLVGHSYGGNVISTAAIGNDQIRALVYFNGWMCDVGESQQQLLEKFEGSLVGPSIRPVPFTSDGGGAAAICGRRVRSNTVGSASVEHTAVLVLARYRGQGDPAGAPALHGRARRRDDRGGAGFARFVRVAAPGCDPAHPAGGRGDRRSRLTRQSPAVWTPGFSIAGARGPICT